ncbi:prevent-host-death family protein [Trinickia symbiotica]|uniref:Antitoxin n=1 Tax=Trinickia symbiotica TaxID=863227 RepID=A0A2N7X6U0_9BURK|nr:type II toxin-antitoxin system Phd/YefM family antitoxin [Trinickia symbiotica]PMS37473.1 prevent-host-death family protein [Trinickia symbiotica]PPK44122.1 prevent-host-death family protein [Trinickia symbiotica]
MRLENIKPITYLRAEAAQIVRDLEESGQPMVITQNGEAKLVIQDVRSYQALQDKFEMLKLLALAEQHHRAGEHGDISELFEQLDKLDQAEFGRTKADE